MRPRSAARTVGLPADLVRSNFRCGGEHRYGGRVTVAWGQISFPRTDLIYIRELGRFVIYLLSLQ